MIAIAAMLLHLIYGHGLLFTGVLIIGLWVVAALAGQWLVHHWLPFAHRKSHNDVIGFTAATGGLIYVVLLAFIASTVWISYDRADSLVSQEASLAGDLFQDSSVLAGPFSTQGMFFLRDYVRTVVNGEWPVMLRGEKVNREGWQTLHNFYEALSGVKEATPVQTAVVQEMLSRLNQLFDARRERLRISARPSLHPVIWFVVVAGGLITVAFCWLFGFERKGLHRASTAMVSATLGLVIFLIVAFNYPFRGQMQISAGPFEQTLNAMERRLGARTTVPETQATSSPGKI